MVLYAYVQSHVYVTALSPYSGSVIGYMVNSVTVSLSITFQTNLREWFSHVVLLKE